MVDERLREMPGVGLTETVDTTTMVRVPGEGRVRTKVVELRGVQAAFPFYGFLELASGRTYSFELLQDHGALVGPELLTQLGLEVGERIAVGQVEFTIRDVVVREPGRQLGGFSFGPRVLIAYDAVEETGLLTFASRATRQLLLRVPDEARVDPLVEALQEDLREAFVRVGSYRRTENRIERNLGRTENYLSLIGFVVVILGGIGVWSVTRVFIQQRIRSVAILRCLGATTGRVMAIYVLQVAVLGLGGSLLGIGVAQAALWSVPDSLADQAATATGLATLSMALTWSAILQGLAVGVLVSLLFALVPLLDIRHAKPLLLLRQGAASPGGGIDWAAIGCHGGRWCRLGTGGKLASVVSGGRFLCGRRFWRGGGGPAPDRASSDSGDPAAPDLDLVSPATRRAESDPTGKSDAGDSAVCRIGELLHHRCADSAVQPLE